MSRKKKKSVPVQTPKRHRTHGKIHIGTITSEQLRKMNRPRQLPTSGFGIHGDTKYNRRRAKEETRRILEDED